jgi:DNA-directed RNA polymerase subunit RPC12/RpoP
MAYVCVECGRDVELVNVNIRCPYCGSRRVIKKRPGLPIDVSTD